MDEKSIVEKIKRMRINKGISLKALAEKTGLTQGYLSRIENSDTAPPIGTLGRIAKGLGVEVSYLLAGQEGSSKAPPKIVVNRAVTLPQNDSSLSLSARPAHGYHYQALAENKVGRNMEIYIITPEFEAGDVLQHEGEEFIYVLDGAVEFNYGDEKLILNTGDNVYFDTHVPHNGRSLGDFKASILSIVYNYKRI